MNLKKTILVASAIVAASQMQAGGILTNTNQSIAFLRNPARDGAIGIDGVYSNPAGVAFLNDGFHFTVNWQCAVQTRTVTETNPYLDHTLGAVNGTADVPTKRYRGHATAPFIPSLGAAYNKGPWSFQFNFAVSGGGGKCEFEKGIGTFESAVGKIAQSLSSLGVKGYGCDNYMDGRQYYYGITLGAAYKVTPNLSVYGGIRGLIGSASYSAQIKDIQVATANGLETLSDFNTSTVTPTIKQIEAGMAQLEPYKDVTGYKEKYQTLAATKASLSQLGAYTNGVDLNCDQTGFGIAPLFGVDWKVGRFNLAAKYEFRTKMSLKNSSNLKSATLDATAQFVDGTSIREDSPALLTFGAQYSPVDIVRINLGYHHFYDKDSKKFGDKQDLLDHGTNEYLGGVEVNCTDRLIVSAGAQITRYGNTDEYISDVSFVTNSWSFGFGASYQANPNVKIEAAYFKTLYGHYKTTPTTAGTYNDFCRTNDVIGVGLVVDL